MLRGFIMKKFKLLTATILGMIALAGCSANQRATAPNTANSSIARETSTKTIYKTKITSQSYDNSCDWLVSGTTDAPDNSKIYVIPSDNHNYSEAENQASSDGAGTWAKVNDGKFKAHINGVTLIDDNAKPNDKINVRVFALPKYKKSMYSELSKGILTKARKLNTVSLTISANQIKYLDSLDDDDNNNSKSSNSSSSSSSNAADYSKVNETIVDNLRQYQGFAQGTLDDSGNATDNGTPNKNFNWSLFVNAIQVRGDNSVEVDVTPDFTALNEEAKNNVAIHSQNTAIESLIENGKISDDDAITGVMTWIKNGNINYGRSKALDPKQFKWNK